jgi:hypothetical protein
MRFLSQIKAKKRWSQVMYMAYFKQLTAYNSGKCEFVLSHKMHTSC